MYASYGNRTHVNSLEVRYATTTPSMLEICSKSMNKGVHRTGIVLLSTSFKAAMLSLQHQCLNYAVTMKFLFCLEIYQAVLIKKL